MSRDDLDMALRRQGVTGSEIATVAGLAPPYWRTSVQDIWERKLALKDEQPQNEAMERGNYLEPAIIRWTADRLGLIAQPCQTMRSALDQLVIATPDALAMAHAQDTAPVGVIEVKSPSSGTARDWADPTEDPAGIPVYYLPQVIWEMRVADVTQAFVGALLDGRLRVYRVGYDEELYRMLLAKAREFWAYVQAREMPPITLANAGQAAEYIRDKFSRQEQEDIVATEDATALAAAERFLLASEQASAAEKEADAAKAYLCSIIGPKAGLRVGGYLATWKQARDSETVDWRMVAEAAGATEEDIARHRKTKAGVRRFILRPAKKGN